MHIQTFSYYPTEICLSYSLYSTNTRWIPMGQNMLVSDLVAFSVVIQTLFTYIMDVLYFTDVLLCFT